MARVASLGLHTPTALSYCFTEKLLPDPPPPDSYQWTTGLPHEELLVLKHAVIWSQGGVIRRVFRYEVEKDPVIQALLVWFPSDEPAGASNGPQSNGLDEDDERVTYYNGFPEGNKRTPDWNDGEHKAKKRVNTWSNERRSYANQLGNFPKAFGGNRGAAVMEDDDEEEGEEEGKKGLARALVVFLKGQTYVYFLSGVMHVIRLPFEIDYAVPSPHGLILQRKFMELPPPPKFSTGNVFTTKPPNLGRDRQTLFTLTDPLSEPGLVITSNNLPCDGKILYISPSSELSTEREDVSGKTPATYPEVIFAVTYHAEENQIVVWQVRYVPQDRPINTQRRPQSSHGRSISLRRSSFGTNTGATTPIGGLNASLQASLGTSMTSKPVRDSLGPGDISSFNILGEDFETMGTRRSSRRVSSMMARSDLAGGHETSQRFADVSSSIGPAFGGPPAPPPSVMLDDTGDDLLNELNMGNLGIDSMDDGQYDGGGFKHEVVMHRLDSFPCTLTPEEAENATGQNGLLHVFTLRDPPSVSAAIVAGKDSPGKRVVLFFVNRKERSFLQLTYNIQIHSTIPKGYSRRSSTKHGAGAVAMGYTPVLVNKFYRRDILDGIKIQDGGVQKIVILTEDGKFSLYSPWTSLMDIYLPPTLARWNPNVVGADGSRRVSRKKDFTRTLSTTPENYKRLEYPEPGGRFTVLDGSNVRHRISISLAPRESATKTCLETLRIILGASTGVTVGEWVYTTWMTVVKYLQTQADPEVSVSPQDVKGTAPQDEWRAFVITMFALAIPELPEPKLQPRKKSAFVRSASMVAEKEWEELIGHDGEWGPAPDNLRSSAWRWMTEEMEERRMGQATQASTRTRSSLGAASADGRMLNKTVVDCISDAREFLRSPTGETQSALLENTGQMPEIKRTGLAVCLVALHLLREEWKLDIFMEGSTRRLAPVLRQISIWLGWQTWAEEYCLEDVEMIGWQYDESRLTTPNLPGEPFNPPDIMQWIVSCVKGKAPDRFTVLQDIVAPTATTPQNSQSSTPRNPFSPPPAPPAPPVQKAVFAKLTPRTRVITTLYTTIATAGKTDVDICEKMVELNVTLDSLQSLPEGVQARLREAIARCQEQPPTTWGVTALDLVGRKDLRMLIEPAKGRRETGTQWKEATSHEASKDVRSICDSTFETETIGSYDPMSELDRQAVSKLLFKDDRRIYEAGRLLKSDKPAAAKCFPQPHWTEHETLEHYREIAARVAMRTLAVPTGRGLFHFSSRIPLLTERFPVVGFNLNCVVKPAGATVAAEKALYVEEKVSWAFFHAGVSAGVSISRDAKEIDTSWIVFNKPPELTNRHGGFLLGLGLNGHLRNIVKWHAYNYLTPKHPMVSIGLLLGMSASFLGTMDGTITRLLSVHVTRLLPIGSADLNIAPLTQTAGVMGIGLLYANTQHRRMSEIMLSEIEYVEKDDSCVPSDTLRDEGYRLAAGFALGFINLGFGADLRGLHDMRLVERLLAIAVGPKKVSIVHTLDKATAGATIAIALIYMKTNDKSVADKIDVPETAHLFDYVRPDIFLLRTVAKNLIMWDKIHGSFEWIRDNLRPFFRSRYLMNNIHILDSEDLPFYNIMAGLCFSVALRYAGSGDENVRDVLIHYLDQFIRLASMPAVNHDQKLTKTTIRNCQDLLSLSVCTVMAGTGDIAVFRRLRRLHGRVEADVPYGSHLATHLAMGVLFLGSGTFTFGTSNIAIASLLCAFYPLFPTGPLDNKSHLQALRHLWVLAVENRCIVPRDVETMRPVQLPITIALKNGEEINKLAPCLLPELDTISSVTTNSSEHWTVVLDFLNSEAHRAGFDRSQSIFVHRRSAHASQSTVFQGSLQALDEKENDKAPFEWLGELDAFAGLNKTEKALVFRGGEAGGGECVDQRLELEAAIRGGLNRNRLKNVAAVLARRENESNLWFSDEMVENLKAMVWARGGN